MLPNIKGIQKYSTHGMSLIEFMCVIAIVVILTAIASPFLGQLMARYQAESAGNHVLSILKLCRIEALKQEKNVGCNINASDENKNVSSIVYVDENASGAYEASVDKLLNTSIMNNTSFLKVTPSEISWTYNRHGSTQTPLPDRIYFCSLSGDKSNYLNSIMIDPKGVVYLKEANSNESCPV